VGKVVKVGTMSTQLPLALFMLRILADDAANHFFLLTAAPKNQTAILTHWFDGGTDFHERVGGMYEVGESANSIF